MAYMSHSPYTGPRKGDPEQRWLVWHDECAPDQPVFNHSERGWAWAPDAMIGKAQCATCRVPLTTYRVTVGDGWVFIGRVAGRRSDALTFTGVYNAVEALSPDILRAVRMTDSGAYLWDIPIARIVSMRAI